MPVPDFQALMLPVLKLFGDGRERPSRDVRDPIAAEFRLSEDEVNEMLPSGRQTRFANRVAWALSYLKQAQCLESPHHGVYRITDRGRGVLSDPPGSIDIGYLMRFPEFVAFRTTADTTGTERADSWYFDEDEATDDLTVTEYDITATPNDFNVRTICDFMESGLLKVPGFQRNYVWDIKRASKLIESLIIGLPIPQVFLYEEARNSFLVIDGQQRLMSLYFFRKGRFPRMEKRPALRRIFDENGRIPDRVLMDDDLFSPFSLQLPSPLPNQPNKFHRLNYARLDEYQTTLDLRTIRNVVIRQTAPADDDSSIYEIFNRLNSGGVNLTPQEIRVSLYHSSFYGMLDRVNLRPRWRQLLGLPEPDLHTKDLEILLRAFSMLAFAADYKPSMTKFLNASSRKFKTFKQEAIDYCEALFDSFLMACEDLDDRAFFGRQASRFNISTFEAVFAATCQRHFVERTLVAGRIDPDRLEELSADAEFIESTQKSTASSENVALRRKKAEQALFGHE